MPQHVERARDARVLQERRQHTRAPVVVVDRRTRGPWEHELAGRAQPVKPQLPRELFRERDAPAAVGGLQVRPGAVGKLTRDADCALLEIDPLPLKPCDLTEAQPGARRRADQERRRLIGGLGNGTQEAITTLVEIMLSAKVAAAARIVAATALLDRGWGKPVQATAFTDQDGNDHELPAGPPDPIDAAGRIAFLLGN